MTWEQGGKKLYPFPARTREHCHTSCVAAPPRPSELCPLAPLPPGMCWQSRGQRHLGTLEHGLPGAQLSPPHAGPQPPRAPQGCLSQERDARWEEKTGKQRNLTLYPPRRAWGPSVGDSSCPQALVPWCSGPCDFGRGVPTLRLQPPGADSTFWQCGCAHVTRPRWVVSLPPFPVSTVGTFCPRSWWWQVVGTGGPPGAGAPGDAPTCPPRPADGSRREKRGEAGSRAGLGEKVPSTARGVGRSVI